MKDLSVILPVPIPPLYSCLVTKRLQHFTSKSLYTPQCGVRNYYLLIIHLLLINDLKFILSAAIPSFYSHQAGYKKIASPASQLDILYSQNLGCIRLQDVDAGGFVKPHSHTLVSIGKSCISNSYPCQERFTKLASNGSVVTKPTKRYDLRTDYNEAGSWLELELVQEENEIHYQHSSHHSLHLCQAPHFPQTLLA